MPGRPSVIQYRSVFLLLSSRSLLHSSHVSWVSFHPFSPKHYVIIKEILFTLSANFYSLFSHFFPWNFDFFPLEISFFLPEISTQYKLVSWLNMKGPISPIPTAYSSYGGIKPRVLRFRVGNQITRSRNWQVVKYITGRELSCRDESPTSAVACLGVA